MFYHFFHVQFFLLMTLSVIILSEHAENIVFSGKRNWREVEMKNEDQKLIQRVLHQAQLGIASHLFIITHQLEELQLESHTLIL